jgi:transposase
LVIRLIGDLVIRVSCPEIGLQKQTVSGMEHKTKKVRRYSERYKQELISEISAGLLSKREATIKYGVSWMSIDRWCRLYGVVSGIEMIDLHLGCMESKEQKPEDRFSEDVAILKQRLRELEVKLRAAELRAEVAELIIDIAEKDLGLEIRKKSGTKQSRK